MGAQRSLQTEPGSAISSTVEREPSSFTPQRQFPIQARPLARERWFWVAAMFLVLLIVGTLLKDKYSTLSDRSFPIRVYDAGDSVRAEWDINSAPIRTARLAVLDIRDGNENKRVALTDQQLHSGKMTISRNSGDLELRMIVFPQDQPGIQQFVRFVGPEPSSPSKSPVEKEASLPDVAPQAIPPPAQHNQLEDQVKQLKEELGTQNRRANRLQEMVRILQNRIAVEGFRNSAPDRRATNR